MNIMIKYYLYNSHSIAYLKYCSIILKELGYNQLSKKILMLVLKKRMIEKTLKINKLILNKIILNAKCDLELSNDIIQLQSINDNNAIYKLFLSVLEKEKFNISIMYKIIKGNLLKAI